MRQDDLSMVCVQSDNICAGMFELARLLFPGRRFLHSTSMTRPRRCLGMGETLCRLALALMGMLNHLLKSFVVTRVKRIFLALSFSWPSCKHTTGTGNVWSVFPISRCLARRSCW